MPSSIFHLPSPISHPRRILVRGVNWLGDAVMTTPALQRLRERFPQAQITLLTHEKLGDLWRHHPNIDDLITFNSGESAWSVADRLRAYDLALILPNSPRSALEMRLARIPQRIGYVRRWRSWLLTHPIPARPGHVTMRKLSASEIKRLISRRGRTGQMGQTGLTRGHQIHDYLHLVAALGADPSPVPPRLLVQPAEIEAAAAKFGLTSDPARPFLGLNPGAAYGPAKRWPLERFIAAARDIQSRTNCTWLILGSKSDLPLADALHSALGTPHSAIKSLAGKTTLRELMAVLKFCRVLLTNDTGPMHLAAALGTPVVVPFGSTSPALTAPGLPGDTRHRLLTSEAACSPCYRRNCPIDFRCMTGIGVERVVEAVLALV
jgi:heptosyltransferase-2